MSKFIVVTKDNIQLYGIGEEMWARHDRPSVVRNTPFMANHIGAGQARILQTVSDEATDVAIEAAWEKVSKKINASDDVEGDTEAFAADFAKGFPVEGKPKKAAPAPAA